MKLILLVFVNFICAVSIGQLHTTNERLTKFALAVSDAALCDSLIQVFSDRKSNLSLAYSGALTALKAKHAFNPLKKLKYFKRGKAQIQAAVEADPSNVEVRFLRYCLQKKSPPVLGYHQEIEEDERFIRQHLPEARSSVLEKQFKTIQKKEE